MCFVVELMYSCCRWVVVRKVGFRYLELARFWFIQSDESLAVHEVVMLFWTFPTASRFSVDTMFTFYKYLPVVVAVDHERNL